VPVAAWKNARTAARPGAAEAIGDSRNPSLLVCGPIQDSGVPTAPDPMNPAEVHHPGSAGRAAMQWGQVVEDVRFARDEMAKMVWAIENAAGEPWPQHERDAAATPVSTPPPPGQMPPVPLKYRIESRVPEYWIPFLPVSLDPASGVVALELASAVASDGHTLIPPRGRVLQRTSISRASPYQIPEEEVPRNGIRVQRPAVRSRWTDGSSHLWQLRRVQPGTGESSSALRFDQALPNR
jgi:hypothetical protein